MLAAFSSHKHIPLKPKFAETTHDMRRTGLDMFTQVQVLEFKEFGLSLKVKQLFSQEDVIYRII